MYWLCCERFCCAYERCLVVLAATEAGSKENKLVTQYLRLLAQNLSEASLYKLQEVPFMLHYRCNCTAVNCTRKDLEDKVWKASML